MRPQITFPKSLKRALNYHEKKVQKGTAELLHAHSFYKLPSEMNFHDKMERFQELLKLNERAENKLIHISLNFHPSEKDRLDKALLVHLADEYMHKIGFGDQPYLVYQHEDAGHPHVHLLSTLIKEDGKRISTQYIGKNVSEPVRKEMEKQYGFIPADKKNQERQDEKQLVITPQKIQAGKSATMRSITNVLDHVVNQYKYTSIHEFNAVLKLFNVKADRGAEDGRIYKHRGLNYVVIDKVGKALTKPIKASAFRSKPTLDKLEGKFASNERAKEPGKKHTKNAIDWAMQSRPITLGELAKLLQKERIDMIARQNDNGFIYGITFINHEKKLVLNGSDIGKEYAANQILKRLEKNRDLNQQTEKNVSLNIGKQEDRQPRRSLTENESVQKSPLQLQNDKDLDNETSKGTGKIIEQVIGPDYGDGAINKELLTEEQRRKKKGFTKQWEM